MRVLPPAETPGERAGASHWPSNLGGDWKLGSSARSGSFARFIILSFPGTWLKFVRLS